MFATFARALLATHVGVGDLVAVAFVGARLIGRRLDV
jgi:hypothetical protein